MTDRAGADTARVDFSPSELGQAVYPMLNSVVLPRPIAWVSTRSRDGVDNLAPHSYFTVSSVDPPVVQFTSVGAKDSLHNVRATRDFVVAVCTRELAELVNLTATDFPPAHSEFDEVGLTREPSLRVAAFRVAESPVVLECRYVDERSFGRCTVVFGEVLHIAVSQHVLREGRVDVGLLAPVARLGGNLWGGLGEVFGLRRVPFAEVADLRGQTAPAGQVL